MWTGKCIVRWAVLSAALLSVGCQTVGSTEGLDGTAAAAWWYTMEFAPTSTSVRGIDVDTMDPTWRAATVLDTGTLAGRLSVDERTRFDNSALSFSVDADLDDDGGAETFFVGVFETDAGDRGRFVAVTGNGRLLQLFQQTGAAGFSALLDGTDEVRWYQCMECGEFETIIWTGNSYVLE